MLLQRENYNHSSQQKLFPKCLTANVLENSAKGQFNENMSNIEYYENRFKDGRYNLENPIQQIYDQTFLKEGDRIAETTFSL